MGRSKKGPSQPELVYSTSTTAASTASDAKIQKLMKVNPTGIHQACPVLKLTPLLVAIGCGRLSAGCVLPFQKILKDGSCYKMKSQTLDSRLTLCTLWDGPWLISRTVCVQACISLSLKVRADAEARLCWSTQLDCCWTLAPTPAGTGNSVSSCTT